MKIHLKELTYACLSEEPNPSSSIPVEDQSISTEGKPDVNHFIYRT